MLTKEEKENPAFRAEIQAEALRQIAELLESSGVPLKEMPSDYLKEDISTLRADGRKIDPEVEDQAKRFFLILRMGNY